MRVAGVVAVVLLLLVACSDSGSDSGAEESEPNGAAPGDVSTVPRPGQVEAPPVTGDPEPADIEAASDAVASVRSQIPYPESVVECLVTRAALDEDLLAGVQGLADSADSLDVVMAASASCAQLVEAGPRFAEALQRANGGGLSDEQLACAAAGYGGLSADEVQAVSGAVANPEAAEPEVRAVLDAVLADCEIDLEGG